MIKELDDGTFVISSHRQWLPGVYATRRAAQWALQFSAVDLERLNLRVRPRPITTEDIARLKRAT